MKVVICEKILFLHLKHVSAFFFSFVPIANEWKFSLHFVGIRLFYCDIVWIGFSFFYFIQVNLKRISDKLLHLNLLKNGVIITRLLCWTRVSDRVVCSRYIIILRFFPIRIWNLFCCLLPRTTYLIEMNLFCLKYINFVIHGNFFSTSNVVKIR